MVATLFPKIYQQVFKSKQLHETLSNTCNIANQQAKVLGTTYASYKQYLQRLYHR